jgi:hypothetical protein
MLCLPMPFIPGIVFCRYASIFPVEAPSVYGRYVFQIPIPVQLYALTRKKQFQGILCGLQKNGTCSGDSKRGGRRLECICPAKIRCSFYNCKWQAGIYPGCY